jgi:hypothetical protein
VHEGRRNPVRRVPARIFQLQARRPRYAHADKRAEILETGWLAGSILASRSLLESNQLEFVVIRPLDRVRHLGSTPYRSQLAG